MSPPSLFTTGLFAATVNQVLERIVMWSWAVAIPSPLVILTPDRPSNESMLNPPLKSST